MIIQGKGEDGISRLSLYTLAQIDYIDLNSSKLTYSGQNEFDPVYGGKNNSGKCDWILLPKPLKAAPISCTALGGNALTRHLIIFVIYFKSNLLF